MGTPQVTIEVATKLLENPPTLHPRPNGTSIRTLVEWFDKKLSSIPSYQSREHGYAGITTQPPVWALRSNTPWQPFPDPGPHRIIDPALDPAEQADAKEDYK